MIIPIREIENNVDHYKFKASYEHALEYQLEKILFTIKAVEESLTQQASDPRWYISDPRFSYNLDSLINGLSTLTEYYHGWVIFSHIGTIKQSKSKYAPLQNDSELDAKIDKLFKANKIGTLKQSTIAPAEYYRDCKRAFMQAYDFLLVGRYHEIYVLNNYLKHNLPTMGYAPKATDQGQVVSIPYIYIDRPHDKLLNQSVYKCLFDFPLDNNGKISSVQDNYYVNQLNKSCRWMCQIGSLQVYNINGIDYLKGNNSVGVSIESIVDTAHALVLDVVAIFLASDPGHITRKEKLNRLINKIKERVPQTFSTLIKS